MKLKHTFILLAAGICLGYIGTWAKITHQAWAHTAVTISTVIKVLAVVAIIIKLIRHPELRNWMNQ